MRPVVSLPLLLLLLLPPADAQPLVVSLGFMAPLASGDCATAWQYLSVAQSAVAAVNAAPWWPAGATLALEVLPQDSPLAAITSAQRFVSSSALPSCSAAGSGSCSFVRGAIVGPADSATTRLVQLVAAAAGVPVLAYAATADSLVPPLATPTPAPAPHRRRAAALAPLTFFRVVYSDSDETSALYAFIAQSGWQQFATLSVRSDYGVAAAALLQSQAAASNGAITLAAAATFATGDAASAADALHSLQHAGARVLVLLCYSSDASMVLALAAGLGMANAKAWTWIGGEWVRQATVTAPYFAGSSATVLKAMAGAVGVVPLPVAPGSALGGALDVFFLNSVNAAAGSAALLANVTAAFPAPLLSPYVCEPLYSGPAATTGLSLDLFGPFVFDAVWVAALAAAQAVAESRGNLSASTIAAQLSAGLGPASRVVSPLTGAVPTWLGSGERAAVPFALINARADGSLPVVGTWSAGGSWSFNAPILWSAGATATPTDRELHVDEAFSQTLALLLTGMVAVLVTGAAMHQFGVAEILPESGATVLIGLVLGACFKAAPVALQSDAGFNEDIFMFVLLPVIIFESGYSLDRRPFFKNLVPILAYAVVGTTVSMLVIGGIVYASAQAGVSLPLAPEEAFAFAALLSATDPVATLTVFSSLRVEPTLNAIVYGESVLNDAVGIVLYRTCASLITSAVTTTSMLAAVGSFFLILIGAVLVGTLVGLVTTWTFSLLNQKEVVPGGGLRVALTVAQSHVQVGLTELQERLGLTRQVAAAQSAVRSAAAVAVRRLMPGRGSSRRHSTVPVPSNAPASTEHGAPHREAEAFHDESFVDSVLFGCAETALLLVFAYASFAIAEAVGFSGIVSSLFCGIAMGIYTRRILSWPGKAVSSAVFKLLASLADTAVFLQIGLNVVLLHGVGVYEGPLIIITLLACLLGRAANVFPLSFALNCFRKDKDKLSLRTQTQMWHAGLRGAIAFASALTFPSQNRDAIVNATASVCLISIFALGMTTTPLLKLLYIPFGDVVDRQLAAEAAAEAEERQRRAAAGVAPPADWAGAADRALQRLLYGEAAFLVLQSTGRDLSEPSSHEAAAASSGAAVTVPRPAPAVAALPDIAEAVEDAGADGAAEPAADPWMTPGAAKH